ncbi:MAG: proprotein convertase P-domain-containing protein, partial [Isosphaeraceae bacterium]
MRTGASDFSSRRFRGQVRPDARLKRNRQARLRRAVMDSEFLEPRTLLATIPAATAVGGPQNISSLFNNAGGLTANQSSVQVAIDPNNPQKMVATWVDNDPALLGITNGNIAVITEMAYSVNAGQTWHPLQAEPGSGYPVAPEVLDPATGSTTSPILPFKYQTDPSLGFDASDNFYQLTTYHNAADVASSSSGALVLQKFSFSGNAPAQQSFTNILAPRGPGFGFGSSVTNVLYGWNSSSAEDIVTHPTMQVDSNHLSFTDPTTGQVQTDPYSGNIYISWSAVDIKPSLASAGSFNTNRIKLIVSSDGGNNFTSEAIADVNQGQGNYRGTGPTSERDAVPALSISQGRPQGESGVGGEPGTPGGQVTVAWDDYTDGQVMANTVTGGNSYTFGGPSVGGPITFGTTTTFDNTVSFPSGFDFSTLSNLSVTVAITDPTVANLGLDLIAPSGDSIVLVLPQTVGGTTNTGVGISGANLGVLSSNGYILGTTFDDNASRDIFDSNANGTNANTSPFVGNYRIEGSRGGGGSSLTSFMRQEIASGINGTWKLETIETSTSAPSSPEFVNYWTLNFTGGVVANQPGLSPNVNDVVLPGTSGLVVPGSPSSTYSTASAASPVGIGPGIVMAQDNTLGGLSQFEGRIYVAFVGYYNVTVAGVKNPTDNTDIFVSYSDDGGRSWSNPLQVNDDQSALDGYSASNDNTATGIVTGRVQFQPEIAVDPVTGTVVMSWRDGRNDASRARVATYIASSIDGGQTWSAQVYANPAQTAVDAITGNTVVIGPEADNNSSGNNNHDATYGYGSAMGLAVYDGQVYPMWSGNFNQGTVVNNAVQGTPMSVEFQPMVIAAGPRIVNSTQGPIAYPTGGSKISFTVTFDRPINPPGYAPTFTTGDVQVFYHDTTNGDPSIPLLVTGVTPVTSSGVGPNNKFGYTQFTVTFDPTQKPDGSSSGINNFTGTYSYLIAPNDASANPTTVTPIEQMIPSYVIAPVTQANVTQGVTGLNLPIPSSGTGGTGTSNDYTVSSFTISGHANQLITGITVYITATHQRAGDLTITFQTPDGRSTTIYTGSGNNPLNFNNAAFPVTTLNGGSVDGTYTLTIHDSVANNTGTLTAWSVKVSSELPTLGLQDGAPMDQNADGTPDQNPLVTPFTGLTPGDVYAVPAPQPTTAVTFSAAAWTGGTNNGGYILAPPFDQNMLPLIVPGPHLISTSVPGGTGSDNLIT